MIEWNSYRSWAQKNGKPCLVVSQGIRGMGREKWKEDGYYYVGRKKIAPYMVIQRYHGWDVLVRFEERDNIQRFEQGRWNVLRRIQAAAQQRREVVETIRARYAVPGSETAFIAMFGDEWHWIFVYDDGVRTGELPPIKKEQLLDELAERTTGDAQQAQLGYKLLLLENRLDRYWIKVHRFEAAMRVLMYEQHPDKVRQWGRPVITFVVNGRRYPYRITANHSEDSYYWPTPWDYKIDMDSPWKSSDLSHPIQRIP